MVKKKGLLVSDILIKNIQHLMRVKNLSVAEVARRAELSRYQVDNILYNRSQNINTVQKMAQALEVPLDDLFDNNFVNLYTATHTNQTNPILKNEGNIHPEEYIIIINCCKALLTEYDKKLSKKAFERWVNILYSYKPMSSSMIELRGMAKGILFYLLEYNEGPSHLEISS